MPAQSPPLPKDTYPYFARTVPPDSIQGQAFWNWIVAFQARALPDVGSRRVQARSNGRPDPKPELRFLSFFSFVSLVFLSRSL